MALTLPKSAPSPTMPPLQEKEVAFILDKSGSMASQREKVISAFNEFLGDLQRAQGVIIRFTLTLFDTVVTIPVNGVSIPEVKPLEIGSYVPGGNTALYDALGQTLNALERRLKDDTTTAITVCILTDGQENSSKEFDQKQIREKIAELDQRPNWTFAFMGADQDAWVAAGYLGISAGNTMSYDASQTQDAMSSNSRKLENHVTSGSLKKENFYEGETDLRKKKERK